LLRQRYKLLTAVVVSGAPALFVFAAETLVVVRRPITNMVQAFNGHFAFLFYFFIALLYCLVSYGVFKLYERTPSILKSLLAVGVTLYSVIAVFFVLFIYTVHD